MTGIEVLLTQVGPYAVSIITAAGGWFVGRRKNKAETSLLEIQGVVAIKEFYESALNDTRKQLDYYIKLTEQNRKEIDANRKELAEMKVLIDQLLGESCTVQNCARRRALQTIKKRMQNNEDDKINLEKINE